MDKVSNFLKNTQGLQLDLENLTAKDIAELKQRRREALSEQIAQHQKEKEDQMVSQLESHLESKDIVLATRTAIDFLTEVYGSELLGIWALRYYKRMTKGDITRFDKASTKLLQMRGDIK